MSSSYSSIKFVVIVSKMRFQMGMCKRYIIAHLLSYKSRNKTKICAITWHGYENTQFEGINISQTKTLVVSNSSSRILEHFRDKFSRVYCFYPIIYHSGVQTTSVFYLLPLEGMFAEFQQL